MDMLLQRELNRLSRWSHEININGFPGYTESQQRRCYVLCLFWWTRILTIAQAADIIVFWVLGKRRLSSPCRKKVSEISCRVAYTRFYLLIYCSLLDHLQASLDNLACLPYKLRLFAEVGFLGSFYCVFVCVSLVTSKLTNSLLARLLQYKVGFCATLFREGGSFGVRKGIWNRIAFCAKNSSRFTQLLRAYGYNILAV